MTTATPRPLPRLRAVRPLGTLRDHLASRPQRRRRRRRRRWTLADAPPAQPTLLTVDHDEIGADLDRM